MLIRIFWYSVLGIGVLGGGIWLVGVHLNSGVAMPSNPLPDIPGVTASHNRGGGRKLPNAGPGTVYFIYTVTSQDGKTLQIHGANRTGYNLLNASAHKTRFVFGRYAGFDSSVTFEMVYPANSNCVGRWVGGNSIIGALSDHTGVCGHGYSVVPPTLPGDGETVTIKPADLLPGNDALSITFGTQPETTEFLIVGRRAGNDGSKKGSISEYHKGDQWHREAT